VCAPDQLAAWREAELREAVRIIGFDELHLLDYRDRELADAPPDAIRQSLVSLIRRTRPTQRDCYACREWNYKWFANDLEEPYTTEKDKPFSWQGRLRVVGGRTNVWGRQSYRLSQQDLKGKSFDGYGDDWPLEYTDLAPYYDIVEDYVGISGQNEGVAELPDGMREAFVLFDIEELTAGEVAELLEIPLGTVASRVRRAREQVRQSLLRARKP